MLVVPLQAEVVEVVHPDTREEAEPEGVPPNAGTVGIAEGKLADEKSAAAELKFALASSGKLPVFMACSSFNRSVLSASIYK